MDFNTSSGLSDPVFGAKINGNDVLLQVRLGLILYYQLSNNLSTMNDFCLPSSADFKERRKSLRNSALWNNSKSISLIQVRKIYPKEELRAKKIIEYGSVFAVVNSTSAAVKIRVEKQERSLVQILYRPEFFIYLQSKKIIIVLIRKILETDATVVKTFLYTVVSHVLFLQYKLRVHTKDQYEYMKYMPEKQEVW